MSIIDLHIILVLLILFMQSDNINLDLFNLKMAMQFYNKELLLIDTNSKDLYSN